MPTIKTHEHPTKWPQPPNQNAAGKAPVFGLLKLMEKRNGRVYTEIVPNCSKPVLQKVIRKRVAPEVIIHSEGWRGYDGQVDVGYARHFRRFITARLLGKLANICADLPAAHLTDSATFKKLTGGDSIEAEYKFGANFSFTSFARLIFSANHPPRSPDASHGFFRRWLVIPFKKTFGKGGAVSEHVLDTRLADPQELSGLLNMALAVLPELSHRGFTESASMRVAAEEFRHETDLLSVWLARKTLKNANAVTPKQELYKLM